MTLEITGRIMFPRDDMQRSTPLRVEVWHGERLVDRAGEPTDREGAFQIVVDHLELEEIAGSEPVGLTLKVQRDDGSDLLVTSGGTLLLEPERREVKVELTVELPDRPSQYDTIEGLAPLLPAPLPKVVVDRLRRAGVASLSDLRAAGGLERIEGLPADLDDPALHALDAHTRL